MVKRKNITAALLIFSLIIVISGCATKFTVNKYPEFYKSSIKSVAVLPFENDTSRKGAGVAIATHASAALAANGTYKITDPARLESILKDQNLPALQQNEDRATEEELAQLNLYQAFIKGKVLSDSFINTAVDYENEDFYYEDYPYWYYPYWYPSYWYYPYYYEYGGQAYVSADVSMVSIPDGTVVGTANVKASVDVTDRPDLRKYSVQMALSRLSDKIVDIFAIVPVKISVHPDKAMRTASSPAPGEWSFKNTFGSREESMYVVLCLPEAAAMNEFEIAITPRGKPANVVASKDYTWERGKYCQSVEFSPAQIAQSNGPGKYSLKFISRGKVIFTRHFKIR